MVLRDHLISMLGLKGSFSRDSPVLCRHSDCCSPAAVWVPSRLSVSYCSKLRHIIDEMVTTEREYVRSLCYIIDSYFPEMERLDLPQDLRGKRSVIFGNLEKLYDFHSQYFLRELESCCNHPLRVSHCFLRHVRHQHLPPGFELLRTCAWLLCPAVPIRLAAHLCVSGLWLFRNRRSTLCWVGLSPASSNARLDWDGSAQAAADARCLSCCFLLPRDTAREAKCLLLKAHLLLQGHPLPCLLSVVSVWNDFSERRGTGLLLFF